MHVLISHVFRIVTNPISPNTGRTPAASSFKAVELPVAFRVMPSTVPASPLSAPSQDRRASSLCLRFPTMEALSVFPLFQGVENKTGTWASSNFHSSIHPLYSIQRICPCTILPGNSQSPLNPNPNVTSSAKLPLILKSRV